jgi:hypothetical protein
LLMTHFKPCSVAGNETGEAIGAGTHFYFAVARQHLESDLT